MLNRTCHQKELCTQIFLKIHQWFFLVCAKDARTEAIEEEVRLQLTNRVGAGSRSGGGLSSTGGTALVSAARHGARPAPTSTGTTLSGRDQVEVAHTDSQQHGCWRSATALFFHTRLLDISPDSGWSSSKRSTINLTPWQYEGAAAVHSV